MVPKVSERTRTQNEEQQRNVSQQQQQAESAVQGAQTRTETVHQQEDAQKADIGERQKEKRRNRRNQDGVAEGEVDQPGNEVPKKLKQPAEGRTIDIRL